MRRFKIDDYFLYHAEDYGYWYVGKIYKQSRIKIGDKKYTYFHYKVVKNSGHLYNEEIGSRSQFAFGSRFHQDAIKIKSATSGCILAALL